MMEARRAVEALRAGVPNGAAIRSLGTDVENLPDLLLGRLDERVDGAALSASPGIVISGGFGAGKSHILGYFRELALAHDYAVSLVTISKETPLFDPLRLYEAAIRAGTVARQSDDLMTPVVAALRGAGSVNAFLGSSLAELEPSLSAVFSAVCHLATSNQLAAEDHAAIARFLSTGRLSRSRLTRWLRNLGMRRLFDIQMPRAAELGTQLFRLAPRLLRATGYRGWVILLDEVELVGRYSALQRGRSYSELGRLLDPSASPGVLTVAAVTDDFRDVVLAGRKDLGLLPARMGTRLSAVQQRWMQLGMEILDRHALELRPPSEADLHRAQEIIATLYEQAYGFRPAPSGTGGRSAGGSFRQYIKGWITRWDLERLYGVTDLVLDVGTIATPLDESPDLEAAAEGSGPEAEDSP